MSVFCEKIFCISFYHYIDSDNLTYKTYNKSIFEIV